MARLRAFTLVELLMIITICVVLVGILMPALGGRRTSRWMQNNTQLRGIHQALVMYAQGNNDYFPGLKPDGSDGDLSVEGRFQILLDGNYFTGDYLVSPHESRPHWTAGPITSANYSYAMLQIPPSGQRRAEWSSTLNADAIALSDRNTGTAASPSSILSGTQKLSQANRFGCSSMVRRYYGPGWAGTVAYNDNRVMIEDTSTLPTQYGSAAPNPADDLFTAASDDDALMVHSGNQP